MKKMLFTKEGSARTLFAREGMKKMLFTVEGMNEDGETLAHKEDAIVENAKKEALSGGQNLLLASDCDYNSGLIDLRSNLR